MWVWIGTDDAHLVGSITDDGVGMGTNTKPTVGGLGMHSMSERARAVNGDVEVGDAKPGTTVRFRLPLVPSP